jgi:hypothetical protein
LLKELVVAKVTQSGDKGYSRNWWQRLLRVVTKVTQGIGGKGYSKK